MGEKGGAKWELKKGLKWEKRGKKGVGEQMPQHLLKSKHLVSVFISNAYINLMCTEYKEMLIHVVIEIQVQAMHFNNSTTCIFFVSMGKIYKVYTCIIIFKQYTCFFKGLLVKYLMVKKYGIWNMCNWGSVVWQDLNYLLK